jgi:hypothetical protein
LRTTQQTTQGGAIANTIHAARSRHPAADRPLLDWNLILIMEPTTIGGLICLGLLDCHITF